MKKIYFVLILLFFTYSDIYSQIDEEKAMSAFEQLQDVAYDAMASFCEYPYNHENSEHVFDHLMQIKNVTDDINSISAPKGALLLAKKYSDLGFYVNSFVQLLRTINGFHSILNEDQMYFIVNCLKKFGWAERIIPVECGNAYFVEYKKDDFKMMFVKNTLLPKENEYLSGSNNLIKVTLVYERIGVGGWYNVGAGKYVMIQYCDDSKFDYFKLQKAKSELVN